MRFPAARWFCLVWSMASWMIFAAEPVVHMLVPGFTVQELPVKLSNINNLRFAPDGRLTALGYDGRIWLLRDKDGDGLEDTAEIFWEKPGLSVPVGMAWSTAGLLVSSHGKVSLLRDTDGDGKADTEAIIASGWTPTDVGSGGVDATAVTLDNQGNIYFGLLVADYSNAYRLRKRKDLKPEERLWLEAHGDRGGDPEEEVSLYDIQSKRGTIQKWDRSTGKLETIATGIRVPYTLAFNKAGDLFNTDQEGETWMPNGNPRDELNHIIPGRNYGFPPRHEKWLPNLISEPPVVAFGPQHESTCGLIFNEPHGRLNQNLLARESRIAGGYKAGQTPALPCAPAQGLFGPKWWEGDAFVAGESRGKIWRVRLVKTPYGYVGKEYLIARLSMLTLDLAISPKGELYVCCHSGLPDWGTGPKGEGRIFKISYTDTNAPQPVIAWAAGPTEARVAFDKPLDPSVTNTLVGQPIDYGEYVRAADRYEVLKPPYQVVKQQEATPRGQSKIRAAKLANGNKTLVLTTDTNSQAVTYALTIPGVKANGKTGAGETLDVDYDLTGVEINWATKTLSSRLPEPIQQLARDSKVDFLNNTSISTKWIPYPDVAASEKLISPLLLSSEDFGIQGAKPEWHYLMNFRMELPLRTEKVHLSSTNVFHLAARLVRGGSLWNPSSASFEMEFAAADAKDTNRFLVSSGGIVAPIAFGSRDSGQVLIRPLPLSSFQPEWVPPLATPNAVTLPPIETGTGDFESGRSLFFSDQLKCSTCHRLRGEGAIIGPDLSNLASRDAASVLRDIKEPSASINPDYVAYNVTLNDGRLLNGFVRAQDEALVKLTGADGKEIQFRPTEVTEMRPSSISLMPTGLLDASKEVQISDLLTFLLNEPPKRSAADLEAVLKAGQNLPPQLSLRPLKIVLVASRQDHGPGQHDYPEWQKKWHAMLGEAPRVEVSDAEGWPDQAQFQSADLLVFYYWNHDWTVERFHQFDAFLARGGGLAVFHSAAIGNDQAVLLAEQLGLASYASPQTKYRHTPLDLNIVAPSSHPVMAGLPRQIHFLDEPYWPLVGDTNRVDVLAATRVDGEDRPMIWTFQKGKGRVFASILGHYSWTWEDPMFRIIALRGLAWAAGEPVGRFESVAAPRDRPAPTSASWAD